MTSLSQIKEGLICSIISIFFLSLNTNAQEAEPTNPRIERPFGSSFFLGMNESGYPVTGIKIDYHINHFLRLDAKAGLYYYSLGPKVVLNKKESTSKVAPYMGLSIGRLDEDYSFFVPVGISYIGDRGFQSSIQISELFIPGEEWQDFIFELSVGWRFR